MKITCGIWLFNKNKEMLLVHPTYHAENFYTIPKGVMDAGETEFEAAKRELHEETNILWSDIEKFITNITELELKVFKNNKKAMKSFVVECDSDLSFLELKCNSMVPRKEPFPEVDVFIWRTIDNLGDISFHHSHEMCLDNLKKILNSW